VPVYTIHAEVEGIAHRMSLMNCSAPPGNIQFCPLASCCLPIYAPAAGKVVRGEMAGREGWLGCQQMVRTE
jgi:undecaprenyl phosphate-alpha-L-ara4FN deformylase